MSLAYSEMKPVRLPDPRINVKTQNKYLFKQPANVVTYKSFVSNSSSNSSSHFSATPPNPNILISPLVYLNVKPRLSVSGVVNNDNGNAVASVSMAELFTKAIPSVCPRQLPISSVIQTLSLKLNTDTTTVNLEDYIHAVARFYSDDAIRAYEMSSSPCQPDFYQKYNDYVDTTELPAANGRTQLEIDKSKGLGLGNNRSPFGKYGENTNESTRSSYLFKDIAAVNGGVAVDYEFDEPLFISPLSSGKYSQMSLVQIQTFDVDVNWSSSLSRMFSCNGVDLDKLINTAGAGTAPLPLPNWNVDLDVLGKPELRFIYMTPHINYPIPDTIIYEFSDFNRISQDISGIRYGNHPNENRFESRETIRSNNIQLSSIPNKVYIFVRRSNSTRSIYTTDTFLRIKEITIDFNGVSGIMSTASELDLWRMSVDNGARISWNDWRYYGGSVLCIDFGKNVGLSVNQAVGTLGTYNFSYKLTFENISTEDINAELYTVFESVGTLTIQNQQVIKQIGIMTSKDAIEAQDISQADANIVENLHGGNFMTGMKNLYSNTKNFAKKAKKFADDNPKLMSGLKTGAKVAASAVPMLLGLGYTKKQINEMRAAGYTEADFKKLAKTMQGAPVGRGGNMLYGGNPVGGAGEIGFPTGGAMLPKNKLMNRVKYDYY